MDWSRLDFDSSNDEASASRSSLDCASMDSSLASVQTQPMDVDAPPRQKVNVISVSIGHFHEEKLPSRSKNDITYITNT